MIHNAITDEYFGWLCGLVPPGKRGKKTYHGLLDALFTTEFVFSIPNDKNRAADGVDLRYQFAADHRIDDEDLFFDEPCSVLEVMVALAVRCEKHIMDDPDIGDRTGFWFWKMIDSIGLSNASDDSFHHYKVQYMIDRFLDRDYEPNGKGGLFTVRNSRYDLREVEIWYQMCWYLDEFLRR